MKFLGTTLLLSITIACGGGGGGGSHSTPPPDPIPGITLSLPAPIRSHSQLEASVPSQQGATYQWSVLSGPKSGKIVSSADRIAIIQTLDGGQQFRLKCEIFRGGGSTSAELNIDVQRRWLTPQAMPFSIDIPQASTGHPSLGTDAEGNVFLAWREDSRLQFSRFKADAIAWDPPSTIDSNSGGAYGIPWHMVFIKPNGKPILIWINTDPESRVRRLKAASNPEIGTNSGTNTIFENIFPSWEVNLPLAGGLDTLGSLHLVFPGWDDLQTTSMDPMGRWSGASHLGPPPYSFYAFPPGDVQLQADTNGSLLALWASGDSFFPRLLTSKFEKGAWAPPSLFDTRPMPENLFQIQPRLLLGPSGKGWALWVEGQLFSNGEESLVASRWNGATWSQPAPLLQRAIGAVMFGGFLFLTTGTDSSGNASVFCVHEDRLKWIRSQGDGWATPMPLTGSGESFSGPAASIGPQGHCMVAWDRTGSSNFMVTRYFDSSIGAWTPAEFPEGTFAPSEISLTPGPSGFFLAAWSQNFNGRRSILTAWYR